ncbi:hypothetical protein G647_06191 [Cladophialophora carrionii CBS 160.54]|uniref:Uncharacterized protein n=1 Tax=Cladophialophora carrionii CBS 160.54 TaxID=1279043 RepID=V9D5E3_9EURO|nr:uncharacterized protein G647_06191 [Cladophialophora carrionii CBS 160.54]ETI22119.1 hypothetical protein G647_06191 [Cladophialophora carrionii CBS 160.54]
MSAQASMESKMASLHIDLPPSSKAMPSKAKEGVLDSWEDDDADETSNTQTPVDGVESALKPVKSLDPALGPPPPTPISPGGQDIDWSPAQVLGGGRPSTRPYSPPTPSTPQSDSDRDRRRPEKTTAAASRMIAAGLGMKAQKKTEEQRQYDRAVREQEMKRRNREKEEKQREKEAVEKMKAAVWDG